MEELGKFHHVYWLSGSCKEMQERVKSRETRDERKFGIYFTPELARIEMEKYSLK